MLLAVVASQRTFNTFLPCGVVYSQFQSQHSGSDIISRAEFCDKLRQVPGEWHQPIPLVFGLRMQDKVA